jgi:hypothetical protein
LDEGFSSVLAFQLIMLEREYLLACQKMHSTDAIRTYHLPPSSKTGSPSAVVTT